MLRTYALAVAGNLVFFALILWLLPPQIGLSIACLLYLALAVWQFRSMRLLEQQGMLQAHFFKQFRPSTVLWGGTMLASLIGGAVSLSMLALFAYDSHEPMRWNSSLLQAINLQCTMLLIWGISITHNAKKKRESAIQMEK